MDRSKDTESLYDRATTEEQATTLRNTLAGLDSDWKITSSYGNRVVRERNGQRTWVF